MNTRKWFYEQGFDELSKQDYKAGYQKVIVHPSENFEHFMVKAAIIFMKTKQRIPVICELRAKKKGVTVRKYDVFDAENLNRIGVEDTSKETDADLVVKIAELPMTARKGLKALENHLKDGTII